VPEATDSRIICHRVPAGELPQRIAACVIDQERQRLPDLGHAMVLLPVQGAAADIARAMHQDAGRPLLLPQLTTLRLWASQVLLDRPVATRTAREALLYEALAGRGWLPAADLWAVSRELTTLFEELTRHAVILPATVRDFAAQLELAYRTRRGAALQLEARLVHELWHLVAADTAALDPEAAYQMRLTQLLRTWRGPLYLAGLKDLSPAEKEFLEACAAQAPVHSFECAAGVGRRGLALALAWPDSAQAPETLPDRAAALRSAAESSPLQGRLRFFGATSAEQEAQAADVTVREWLLEGRRRIAVIVLDRLVARRARALLERAGVLVRDEAGWAFSTTSAATVIGRWLDVASGDCYHRDLLDLVKSPFAFHDWPREQRQQAVLRLEREVRDAGVISGLSQFLALAEERGDAEVRQMLVRVQRGLAELGRGRRPLQRWMQALHNSLAEIGVHDGLLADAAGQQLLALLERLATELAASKLAVSFAEWRRWLSGELEGATFVDRRIESPVVFLSLPAARLRIFDAVLMLGADAAHLPGAGSPGLFFNQGVRAQLGLPTQMDRIADVEDALTGLLASSDSVMLTWQRTIDGEPNLLSPQFERLDALHRLAYEDKGLEDLALAARLAAAAVRSDTGALPAATAAPAPAASRQLLPEAISASAYSALMACPYQFHARYLLGLAEIDDVQELIEKADYGRIVHDVLHAFHKNNPRTATLGTAEACAKLEQLSVAAFAAAVSRNYLAQAWLERWRSLIPAYVDWQCAREAEGWRWHDGEARREITITTPSGVLLRLYGRIDRIDAGPEGAVAVIDYKTQRQDLLRRKAELAGEDVQLPVYALLWGGPVAAALFLSLEQEKVGAVAPEVDWAQLPAAVGARLGELYDALRAGAALPAQGIDVTCNYCDMRGLCRRNYWP